MDFLIIPSRYEPCGLTQMIAMHYGTIPIARATGGLKDTISDVRENNKPNANGFLFPEYSKQSMNLTLENAFELFRKEPKKLQTLISNGMQIDWSWKLPAQKYLALYTDNNSSKAPAKDKFII